MVKMCPVKAFLYSSENGKRQGRSIGEVVELGYKVGAVKKTENNERQLPEAGLSHWVTEIMDFFKSALSLENFGSGKSAQT